MTPSRALGPLLVTRTEGFLIPSTPECIAATSSSTSPFLPGCGVYVHGRPVFDVILLSQLLAGEVHVLLPQPLALPTCFLRKITGIKEREDPEHR